MSWLTFDYITAEPAVGRHFRAQSKVVSSNSAQSSTARLDRGPAPVMACGRPAAPGMACKRDAAREEDA